MKTKEQKTIIFTPIEGYSINDQLETEIEKHSVDGWYLQQVVITHYVEYHTGYGKLELLHSSLIILHRDNFND